jgi:hypothetical protein
VNEWRAIELSAARSGGSPKLCPVGESRFKNDIKPPGLAVAQSLGYSAFTMSSAGRAYVFALMETANADVIQRRGNNGFGSLAEASDR